MTSEFALRFDEATGRDEFLPTLPKLEIDLAKLPAEAVTRLGELLQLAGSVEIIFHLNRLLLHRKKTGLGEYTIPMFINDVAGDLRRVGISSLGSAFLVDYLRANPKSPWFPDWPEIEAAAVQIEKALTEAREATNANH